MSSGVFAINRHYFIEELGHYDPMMQTTGAEAFELSFKVSMRAVAALEQFRCRIIQYIEFEV